MLESCFPSVHRGRLGRARSAAAYAETSPLFGRGAASEVHFQEPELTIEFEGLVTAHSFFAWSAQGGKACADCIACPAPLADLEAAFINEKLRVALVVIRYAGASDICPDPNETYHAVRF
jgi:hypothetical protein